MRQDDIRSRAILLLSERRGWSLAEAIDRWPLSDVHLRAELLLEAAKDLQREKEDEIGWLEA